MVQSRAGRSGLVASNRAKHPTCSPAARSCCAISNAIMPPYNIRLRNRDRAPGLDESPGRSSSQSPRSICVSLRSGPVLQPGEHKPFDPPRGTALARCKKVLRPSWRAHRKTGAATHALESPRGATTAASSLGPQNCSECHDCRSLEQCRQRKHQSKEIGRYMRFMTRSRGSL